MGAVRLQTYNAVSGALVESREVQSITLRGAVFDAVQRGYNSGMDFLVIEPDGAPFKLYWTHSVNRSVPTDVEMRALVDAKVPREGCANCNGDLNETYGCISKDGAFKFCDHCGGLADALGIGARSPAMLYDDGKGHATSWTGPVMGDIVHKHHPQDRSRYLHIRPARSGMRGAVRYRVLMLDGSLWHGSGPTDNGNYIRLKPMVGQ